MLGPTAGSRPLSATTIHVAILLSAAFAILAGAAGYWGVVRATDLARSPDDAAVIAASRTVPRGRILDRDGTVLARNEADENGELFRVYISATVSQVVGYASRIYGRAGLERTYDAELTGLAGDPLTDAFAKFGAERFDPKDLTLSLSYDLQKAAIAALGKQHGAVVMLDPRSGEVLALASTPTYAASKLANPATAAATFEALRDNPAQPLLPRATLGRYVPGSVFKIVTAIAGLGSGAITPETTYPEQPRSERDGLLVEGFPRPRRAPSRNRLRDARPGRGDRGLVQHLVRVDRARDGWRGADRLRRSDGVWCTHPVRPPDRGLTGHQRKRDRSGWLRRRRRARQRRIWAGGDVRDTAADGARRIDGRQRWRADAAPNRDRPDRQGRDPDDQSPIDGSRAVGRRCARPSRRRWSRPWRVRSVAGSRPARRCPASRSPESQGRPSSAAAASHTPGSSASLRPRTRRSSSRCLSSRRDAVGKWPRRSPVS